MAIELASRRVTVVEVGRGGKGVSVVGYASEPLPGGAIVPAPAGVNIPEPARRSPKPAPRAGARRRARRAARRARRSGQRRARLVAAVRAVAGESRPTSEQLIRWQLKKATPFPIEDAQRELVSSRTETDTGPSIAAVGRAARCDRAVRRRSRPRRRHARGHRGPGEFQRHERGHWRAAPRPHRTGCWSRWRRRRRRWRSAAGRT